jgi:hypothetical protein
MPVVREKGDKVIGGTINTEGTLRVQVKGDWRKYLFKPCDQTGGRGTGIQGADSGICRSRD